MARIVSLDDVDANVRAYLNSNLRVMDEAVVLPQAHRSAESNNVKNVVMRLSGSEAELDPQIFSPNWFAGVSFMQVPVEKVEPVLKDDATRRQFLARLVEAVPSEMADSQLQVGPELEGDELDRDKSEWACGFDGPGCCVGIYSALQRRSPDWQSEGMARAYKSYYLVCKTGAGVAGQTFHARLTSALRDGVTLDDALSEGGKPGARALRRVAQASKRNRGRVLLLAAEALGMYGADSVSDNASPTSKTYRVAIPQIDVTFNSLSRVETGVGSRSIWQYAAGCVDAAVSSGMATSSNVAEGFVAFVMPNGEARIHLRNEAYSCLPFCSPRICSNRAALFVAVEEHKRAARSGGDAHADAQWVSSHFDFKSHKVGEALHMAPPCIWGSHASENFLSEWSRELGVSRAVPVRMAPELVALSAVESGKLRVAVKAVQRDERAGSVDVC